MTTTRVVAALAYPGVQLLDIVGPLEAFNLAAQQLIDDGERRDRAYEVRIVGRNRGAVQSMSGITVQAQQSLADPVADIDTLLLPGALTGDRSFFEDRAYIEWVREAATRVRRVCSVCSGALLLAAAGLLDGRRATTHWMDADELRRRFPRVRVDSNQIYLVDGGVYTSGGITAGIDLALALIEEDHSRPLALRVAKRLLVFLKRPGDQLQFNSLLAAQVQPTRFQALLDWVVDHLDSDLEVATLARRACMSERTFRRHFEADLGQSPSAYIQNARLTKAQSLIETTSLSFSDIARRCGFASGDALRYVFTRALEITPREYRHRFGQRGGA